MPVHHGQAAVTAAERDNRAVDQALRHAGQHQWQFFQLRSVAPGAQLLARQVRHGVAAQVLAVADGQTGQPRWLRQDYFAALLGEARVWVAPLPAGAVVTRQLRIELLALQITADRSAVMLQARWTLSDPGGRTAPMVSR